MIASIASVSVVAFDVFRRAKLGAKVKNIERGRGRGAKETLARRTLDSSKRPLDNFKLDCTCVLNLSKKITNEKKKVDLNK